MAIDSRDKRASAINVSLPWRGLWPLPDGSLNAGDRQQACSLYRGIAAGAPVIVIPASVSFVGASIRSLTFKGSSIRSLSYAGASVRSVALKGAIH